MVYNRFKLKNFFSFFVVPLPEKNTLMLSVQVFNSFWTLSLLFFYFERENKKKTRACWSKYLKFFMCTWREDMMDYLCFETMWNEHIYLYISSLLLLLLLLYCFRHVSLSPEEGLQSMEVIWSLDITIVISIISPGICDSCFDPSELWSSHANHRIPSILFVFEE